MLMPHQEVACLFVGALVSSFVWLVLRPATISMTFAAGIAVIFASAVFIARNVVLETMYQVCAQKLLPVRQASSRNIVFSSVVHL